MQFRKSILEWLIIGGGIHGTYLSHALLKKRITTRPSLAIIDPNDELMGQWKRVTANVGMSHLRSPSVHHIDVEPFSLKHFAECQNCKQSFFIPPNERPSLDLFNEHSAHIVRRIGLHDIHVKSKAINIALEKDFVEVETEKEILKTQNLILALGQSEKRAWPTWAKNAKSENGNICHVLEDSYCYEKIPDSGEIVVVGGGMSAVQTALSLIRPSRKVTLLSPHSLRQNNYDADPGWMGPKYLSKFRRISSYRTRREMITKARNNGSITYELKQEVNRRVNEKTLKVLVNESLKCNVLMPDLMLLNLDNGDQIGSNYIVLATGYNQELPGGKLVQSLISKYDLACAECGFPITDSHLKWHDKVYVSGALAELEVGPVSRNIIGARMAADKIIRSQKVQKIPHLIN